MQVHKLAGQECVDYIGSRNKVYISASMRRTEQHGYHATVQRRHDMIVNRLKDVSMTFAPR